MTRTLWLALALVACGSSAPTASTPAAHEAAPAHEAAAAPAAGTRTDISVARLAELRAAGDITLVDVRTDAEYAGGHVPGALHVPLDTLSADNPTIAGLPKDKPVYFICQSGGRSSRAADAMAKAGLDTVNVEGGTGGWIAAGYPVE
ncbi:MAG: rhodanese-like domain-containing protein [Alphaproteobacteria bacterium]|nr:rhodanese-like domain-containing protein [Alphaproteobacteria bacterium]